MSDAKQPPAPPPPPQPGRFAGAILSYLVPGLGQIYQGVIRKDKNRLSKGVFFMVSLLGMFFYGMYLGEWKNVYLPHVQEYLMKRGRPHTLMGRTLPTFAGNVYGRLQFAGQFWIGVAAWPALWDYFHPDKPIFRRFQASPGAVKSGDEAERDFLIAQAEAEDNALQTSPHVGKRWDIAWVYTVVAGVLNVLVIYDAYAGPVFTKRQQAKGAAT